MVVRGRCARYDRKAVWRVGHGERGRTHALLTRRRILATLGSGTVGAVARAGTTACGATEALEADGRLGGADAPAFAPDGRALAVTASLPPPGQGQQRRGTAVRSRVWRWGLPGEPRRPVTAAPEGACDPARAPDGQHLADAGRSAGRHDVWLAGAEGSGARRVTTAAGVPRARLVAGRGVPGLPVRPRGGV